MVEISKLSPHYQKLASEIVAHHNHDSNPETIGHEDLQSFIFDFAKEDLGSYELSYSDSANAVMNLVEGGEDPRYQNAYEDVIAQDYTGDGRVYVGGFLGRSSTPYAEIKTLLRDMSYEMIEQEVQDLSHDPIAQTQRKLQKLISYESTKLKYNDLSFYAALKSGRISPRTINRLRRLTDEMKGQDKYETKFYEAILPLAETLYSNQGALQKTALFFSQDVKSTFQKAGQFLADLRDDLL